MKRLLLILILILSFQTLTKADDIRDFEIEGISIGDSLLDHFSLEEINKKRKVYYPNSKKYFQLNFFNYKSLTTYDHLGFLIKENDKNFIVYEFKGSIDYKKNIKDCYKKESIIVSEIKKDLNTNNIKNYGKTKHQADKSGKSTKTATQFYFENGGVLKVSCFDWSKEWEKKGEIDNLKISIASAEAFNWFINEAY